MKVTIEYHTDRCKIVDVLEFQDYKKNETLQEFKERVAEHLEVAIFCQRGFEYRFSGYKGDLNTLRGMIRGMEKMGAKFVKTDGVDAYFEIRAGADIDDESKLKIAKQAFQNKFGLGVKVRRVD